MVSTPSMWVVSHLASLACFRGWIVAEGAQLIDQVEAVALDPVTAAAVDAAGERPVEHPHLRARHRNPVRRLRRRHRSEENKPREDPHHEPPSVAGHTVPYPLLVLTRAMLETGWDGPAEIRETHVSLVVLTGDRAYKLKKEVRLPFLDLR